MATTLIINGKRWVAGLTWRTFEDRPNRDDLREMGDELDADWYALRTGESAIQAGYADEVQAIGESKVKPRGAISLAAAVADIKPQPWLGIFRVAPGLWWYIAVRDGNAILPDGDIIGGEEEIHKAREKHASHQDWEYYEGDPEKLAEFLEEGQKKLKKGFFSKGLNPAPLQRLDPPPTWPYYAGLSAALLAIGGGYLIHQKHEEAAMRAARIAAARAHRPLVPVVTPSWEKQAKPGAFLHACQQALSAVPIASDGWMARVIVCSLPASSSPIDQPKTPAGRLQIEWKRGLGAVADNRPNGALSSDGNAISEVKRFPLVGNKDSVTLPTMTVARDQFWTAIQSRGLSASLSKPSKQQTGLPGAGPGMANHAVKSLEARIQFEVTPDAATFKAFDRVPGFRVTTLAYSLKTGKWEAIGELHFKYETGSDAAHRLPMPRSAPAGLPGQHLPFANKG